MKKRIINFLIISIFGAVLAFSILCNKSAAKVAYYRVTQRITNTINK
jgi:hypothetical protein